jgi:D-alanine transaminase
MTSRISFLNGQFIEHDKAFVHIEDRGFQFADGVYEVILFSQGKLIDGVPHMQRLLRSLAEVKIKHNFLPEQLTKIALELFAKNNLLDASLYLQITRGATNRVPHCPQGLEPTIVMTASPAKKVSAEEFEAGLSLMTHEDIRWHRCDIKTVGLLASTLVNQKAKDLGFNDAVFVRNGVVTEGTFSNLFLIDQAGNLVTKEVDNFILCGITRNRILDLAQKNGIKVIEKSFGVDELLKAKEVFLSSSTLLIRPVTKIDNKPIGNGKAGDVARKISELYKEFLAAK